VTQNPAPADPYSSIAELYDLEHSSFEGDLDLYLNLALAVGDPILELGCGTGRLLVPLAEAGHRVVGIDASQPMLERARVALEVAGVSDRVALHHGSMTEATAVPDGSFGLAVVALNGLLLLPSADEQRQALTTARRALDPRGQLVLDILNPTPETLRSFDQTIAHEGTWPVAGQARVDKYTARRVSPADQRIETELWYDIISADGIVRRVATSYPMRYIHRAELELMLELAGFTEWLFYGSYDLDPFDDTAERLIATAEVLPSREHERKP